MGIYDSLVVIAEDKASLEDPEGSLPKGEGWMARRAARVTPRQCFDMPGQTWEVEGRGGGLPADEIDSQQELPSRQAMRRGSAPPKRVLILGWHSSMGLLLRALDDRLGEGSGVYIISELPLAAREEDLIFEGVRIAEDGTSSNLPNLCVHQLLGSPLCYAALSRLPVERADVAIVLGDGNGKSDDQTDSEVVSSTLLLQQLRLHLRRLALSRGETPPPPLAIASQLLTMNSGLLLKRHPDALRITPLVYRTPLTTDKISDDNIQVVVFQRSHFAATALSAAGHSEHTWEAINKLLTSRSTNRMAVISAEQVLRSARTDVLPFASFHDLRAEVIRKGHGTLIGWRRAASSPGEKKTQAEHELNPSNKERKLQWSPADELIVIQNTASTIADNEPA